MSQEQNTNLKRGLKSRHLSMIAMGGAIGTGIFLAMGDTLHQAGVGGAFVAYGIIGVMVYFLCTSLGRWQHICQKQVLLELMQQNLLIQL